MTKCILLIFLQFLSFSVFSADALSYSGRLVNNNGSPVPGPVTIRAELTYINTTTNALDPVMCTTDIPGVPLTKGVFHIKLNFDCTVAGASLTQVLAQVPTGKAVVIRITDVRVLPEVSKVYSFQSLHSVPFSNIAEQLTQMGAINDQVLKWNNTTKKWEPGTPGGGGTVTSVSATLPISVATGTSTPLISITQSDTSTNGFLSSTDWNTFNNKQGTIAAGTTAQYYRGDKSWQTLDTNAVPENINLYFTNARALGVPLAGFSATTGAIVATDTVLQAFGKSQGQINALTTAGANYLVKNGTDTLSGTVSLTNVITATATGDIIVNSVPLMLTSAVNKTYVDAANDLKVSKAGDTMSGVLTLDSDLKLKGGGANYVTIKGHATTAAYNLFLPITAGTSGYVLSTDGSGNTSWINPASVAQGSSTVDSASIVDDSIMNADINSAAAIAQSKIANLTTDLAAKQTTALASGNILVGSAGNIATSVAISNDATLSNAGVLTLANTSVVPSTYSSVTVDAKGRVTGGTNPTSLAGYGITDTLVTEVTATAPITITGTTVPLIAMPVATTSVNGYLAATDWTIFNSKQPAITAASNINMRELRLNELAVNGTDYVAFKSPDALAANIVYTLPAVDGGNGQVLTTNSSGLLSWTTVATGGTTLVGDVEGTIGANTIGTAKVTLTHLSATGTKNSTTYLKGDNTWSVLQTDVQALLLSAYTLGTNAVVTTGDSIVSAFGKLQKQITDQTTSSVGGDLTGNLPNPTIAKIQTVPVTITTLTTKNVLKYNGTAWVNSMVAASDLSATGTTDATTYLAGDNTWKSFNAGVLAVPLTGLDATGITKANGTLAATDSMATAFNKLLFTQGDYVSKSVDQTINGTLAINSLTGFITVPTPVNPNDAANKGYVDGFGQWIKGSGGNAADLYFNTGKVGIGTATPQVKLQVSGQDLVDNGILVRNESSSVNTYPSSVVENYNGTGIGHPFVGMRNSGGSYSSPTALPADNVLGAFVFYAHNGTQFIEGGRASFISRALPNATTVQTDYELALSNGTSESNVLNIRGATGNVGIGTTGPTSKLDVRTSGTATAIGLNSDVTATSGNATGYNAVVNGSNYATGVLVDAQSSGGVIGMDVSASGNVGATLLRGINVFLDDSNVAGSGMRIFSSSATNASKAIEIASGFDAGYALFADTNGKSYFKGNVGIGTTTPGSALDVKGTIRLTGATSGYVGFAPADVAGDMTYTFPATQGTSGQVLSTDGVATTPTLSWTTPLTTASLLAGDVGGTIGSNSIGSGKVTSTHILDSTIVNADINFSANIDISKLGTGAIDNTEFNYLDGVTSAIQAQLDGKQGAITAGTTAQYYRGDKTFVDFATDVRGSVLTGLSSTAGNIAATDTVLGAFGKLLNTQTDYVSKSGDNTVTGSFNISGITAFLNIPTPTGTTLTEAANVDYVKTYVGSNGQWLKGIGGNAADIYFNTGKIGIGTSAPNTALDLNGALSIKGIAAPAVSPAGEGRIYFDSTANKIKISSNGEAYSDISTPSFPLTGSVGTATTPTYSFVGDTNTGMYQAGAEQLAFTTNGTQRLRIQDNSFYLGSMGSSTSTTPPFFMFDSRYSGAGGSTGVGRFYISVDHSPTNTGSINYPGSGVLHSFGGSSTQSGTNGGTSSYFRITNSGGYSGTGYGVLAGISTQAGAAAITGPQIGLWGIIDLSGGAGLPTLTSASAVKAQIRMQGTAPGGSTINTANSIEATISTSTNDNVSTWNGVIVRAPSGTGSITNKYALVTEAGAGNVGIGTLAPNGQLSNTANNVGDGGTYAAPAGTGITVKGLNWEGSGAGYVMQVTNASTGATSNGLNIYTVSADAGSTIISARSDGATRFLVRADGNVGVGTMSPTANLQLGEVSSLNQDANSMYVGSNQGGYAGGIYQKTGNYAVRSMFDSALGLFKIQNAPIGTSGGAITYTDRMTVSPNGNVGIAVSSASEKLEVAGNIKATEFLYSSDRSLKKNIVNIDDSLGKILALRGVEFDWKKTGVHEIGLIAQEVEEVEESLVVTSAVDGLKSVKYGNVVALLIEAMKVEHQKIEDNKKRFLVMSNGVEKIDQRVRKLEREISSLNEENLALQKKNLEISERLSRLEKIILKKHK